MQRTSTLRRRLNLSGGILALMLSGCADGIGPDITVTPLYTPTEQIAASGNQVAVAVKVLDQRQTKGPIRPDGREVLVEGDKGKIFSNRPATDIIADDLTSALTSAGFVVKPDAPIVVEATLTDLPVHATQFTNWGLPSERASTLDALGALIPGPVRPTDASASLTVVVRKQDARIGFTHTVNAQANNSAADAGVVEQTVDQAINGAVTKAVIAAAPDVPLVARTPVTDSEIQQRSAELADQENVVKAMAASLAQKQQSLDDDRAALEQQEQANRDQLKRDRAQLAAQQAKVADQQQAIDQQTADLAKQRAALTDSKKTLDQQSADADAERTDLTAKQKAIQAQIDAIKASPNTTADSDKALAKLKDQQTQLDAQGADLKQRADALTAREQALSKQSAQLNDQAKSIDDASKQLGAQKAQIAAAQAQLESQGKLLDDRQKRIDQEQQDLRQKTDANVQLTAALDARSKLLDEQNAKLLQWQIDLKKKQDNFQPPPEVTETRPPLIVLETPDATMQTTSLPQLNISGIVAADHRLKRLDVIVNHAAPEPLPVNAATDVAPVALTPGQSAAATITSQKFKYSAQLNPGANEVTFEAVDDQNLTASTTIQMNFAKSQGTVYLLCIGIDDYSNHVPSLNFAAADASDIAQTIATALPGQTIKVTKLINEQANRDGILRALKDLTSDVTQSDTVILFLSGHGSLGDPDPDGAVDRFFVPYDCDPTDMQNTAISMSYISGLLQNRLTSERNVLLADTCFSGGARAVGTRGILPQGTRLKALGGNGATAKECAIISACKDNEDAEEKSQFGHGVFSYFVMRGLQGAADIEGKHQITVDDLFRYVNHRVVQETHNSQNPELTIIGNEGESIVLSQKGSD